MTRFAVDTSFAVAFLQDTHPAHRVVHEFVHRIDELVLTAQSLAETYSVLTRLPGDAMVEPDDVVRLIAEAFGEPPLVLAEADMAEAPRIFAEKGIVGGAVYDALVALTATLSGVSLLTRDRRAQPTYAAVGAFAVFVDGS